jgi:hypothetical protein
MKKVRTLVLFGAAVLASAGLSGCNPFSAYISPAIYSMGMGTPIPVPAWVTERMEEKYNFQNDHRTPIMPPIRPGFPPPLCEDPPSQEETLRAMPHVKRGVPYVCEEFRDDVSFTFERIVDKIDPARFFPLVGPAQLHHCHWKCTIYYTETIESGYPFPFRCRKPRVEVVYIDKDHLHLAPGCGGPEAQQVLTRDLTGP